MEDPIRLCLSLQSAFSDFLPFPSGTGKLPAHLMLYLEVVSTLQREAKAWEQTVCSTQGSSRAHTAGSVSGNLALLSGHSSHPCLCPLSISGSAAAPGWGELCPEGLLTQRGTAGAGQCPQGHRQGVIAPSPPGEPVTKAAQSCCPVQDWFSFMC